MLALLGLGAAEAEGPASATAATQTDFDDSDYGDSEYEYPKWYPFHPEVPLYNLSFKRRRVDSRGLHQTDRCILSLIHI